MKEKFIKSTIILIIGGLITKLLGMIIRIILTRIIGLEGIGLYMLILPSFNLFITIATLSFPTAIAKIVAEDKNNNKKILPSLIPISFIINIVLIIVLILIAPVLANNLLHDERLYYPIIAIGLVLPFISLSSIARGYFFGKEKMFPHVLSNVFEQIIRLFCIVIIVPYFLKKGLYLGICATILINIISELASILILFIFLPKKIKYKKEYLKIDTPLLKDVMDISIPTTLGRLIGAISYFFEPIIITSLLLFVGYTNNYVVTEYGIVTGYVMPILLLPSFFTLAISNALLPTITKNYANKNIAYVSKKIKQACFFSILLGIIWTIFILIFPSQILKLIYNTSHGIIYLRILAPFFLIFYLQAPLASALQAINKSKATMKANIIGSILKILIIIFTSLLKIGMYPLIIANCFTTLLVTYIHYIDLKHVLK